MSTRLAVAQLDVSLGDVSANEARARRAVEDAAAEGADLVVFPELQLSGYALQGAQGDTATLPSELSRVAGTSSALLGFHERNGSATYDSAGYVEAGRVLHVQRKVCLVGYPPFSEDLVFTPGQGVRAFDTSLGRVAVLVCNDAWQPAFPLVAVQDGARLLLVPSASSTAVADVERYWRDLTRFYAQMLQCFVVFANRVGAEGELSFWGGSHVVDPRGRIVAEAPRDEESLLVVDVELDDVDACRRELPIADPRQLAVLRAELERLGA
jgi:predicted amidohydrolase